MSGGRLFRVFLSCLTEQTYHRLPKTLLWRSTRHYSHIYDYDNWLTALSAVLHRDSASATWYHLISAAAAALTDVAGLPPCPRLQVPSTAGRRVHDRDLWGTVMALKRRREHAAKLPTHDLMTGQTLTFLLPRCYHYQMHHRIDGRQQYSGSRG